MMKFHFEPMTPQAAMDIAQWHYPGVYSFYDLDQDPEDREEFLDPKNWENAYYAVYGKEFERRRLIGFFTFFQDRDSVTIGLGLHPEYTGKGLGKAFVQAGLNYGDLLFHPTTFRLSVAAFNLRAIRVYEHLGFSIEKVVQQQTNGGTYEFVQMGKQQPTTGDGNGVYA